MDASHQSCCVAEGGFENRLNAPEAVSATLCCYTLERWSDIVAAIDSLRAQTLPPAEIVIVVDHNPELLGRLKVEFPDLVVVPNGQARGLAGARNTALAIARAPLVAFLDDDAVASQDWLERLTSHLARPEVAGAGSMVSPRFERGRPSWLPTEFDWVLGCTHSGLPSHPTEVRNTLGGASVVRRDLARGVGGFRHDLGRVGRGAGGCEETEFFIRLQQQPDASVVYDPTTSIRHRVPSQRTTPHYFIRRCYGEGRSKALVTRYAGARKGLAAERAYVRQTLTRAMLRELHDLARLRLTAVGRLTALSGGLLVTALGFATGRVEAAMVKREP